MDALFACIVQPKVIEFNVADQKLHRAQKDEELRAELDAVARTAPGAGAGGARSASGAAGERVTCQPGGGCWLLEGGAAQGPGQPVPGAGGDAIVSMATVGSAVCVFDGCLINAEQLAEAYAPVPEDEPSPDVPRLSGAELMCHMYAQVGVDMLGLLRGAFTFVLYESKTSRVLAARDGSGRCPLFQARSPRDSLVLSPSRELLEGADCRDVTEFLPGDYKYGWSATPRRYTPADHTKLSRRSLDQSPAHHGHPGASHHGTPTASRAGSRRTSLDAHHAHDGGGGGGGGGGNRSRRTSMDHGGGGAAAISSSPHPHPPHPPYRTYIVSADDPRVIKAAPGRPKGGAAASAVPVAASAPGSLAAEADAASSADRSGTSWGGRSGGAPGSVPKVGSASSSGGHHHHHHHDRRRSVDQQGPWRSGAGGRSGAVPAAAAAAGGQSGPEPGAQASPKQQQGHKPSGGAGGGGQPRDKQGAGNGGHTNGNANGGGHGSAGNGHSRPRGNSGSGGRPSQEGRTPGKPQSQLTQQLRREKEQVHGGAQAPPSLPTGQWEVTRKAAGAGGGRGVGDAAPSPAAAAAATAAAAVVTAVQPSNGDGAGAAAGVASLRVDAPEWKPVWAASAAGTSPPVAVAGGSS